MVTSGGNRTQSLSELVQRNIEKMAFPPSEREASAFSDVMALPRVVANRPPADALLAAGFVHYDCHRNCAEQASNDPMGISRHVVGWLPYANDLILHSVVAARGKWICLTPQLVPAPSQFDFIPDPHLEWRDHVDGYRIALRHGQEIPETLRKDPHSHIRMRDEFLESVAAGMSVLEARDEVARRWR